MKRELLVDLVEAHPAGGGGGVAIVLFGEVGSGSAGGVFGLGEMPLSGHEPGHVDEGTLGVGLGLTLGEGLGSGGQSGVALLVHDL